MSGIEVAGLVLGAIPLLAKAFEIYADCVSTVRRYKRYERGLFDLYEDIDSEYIIFLNTCEQLLDGIVDSNAQKTILLEDPGGDAWKDKELENSLKRRLARSYDRYMSTIEGMDKTVNEIDTMLKLGPDGKVQIGHASKFKHELKRLKFSIDAKDYEGLIARFQKYNRRLRKFTGQGITLEASRSSPAPTLRGIPDFRAIQTCASHVFNVLSTSLQSGSCGCATAHSINLRLESRRKSENLSTFRVVVSYNYDQALPENAPWRYEALDVHPFVEIPRKDLTPPTPKAKKTVAFAAQDKKGMEDAILRFSSLSRIENLCWELPQIRSRTAGDCVGFLEAKAACHKAAIFQTSTFVKEPSDASITPLHTIFADETVGQGLWWSAKLRVAVVMASSLLQLHHTPWLDDEWSKQDISILKGVEGEPCDQVFISRTCDQGPQQCRTPRPKQIPVAYGGIRSRPLFALGILLIELCVGKSFEELRQQRAPDSSPSNSMDQALVEELIEKCYLDRGIRYGDVVQRCIWCSFDTRKADLEDAQFRKAVYDGVVLPLEEDLNNFGGTFM